MDYIKDLHELCETLSREIGEANDKIRKAGGKLSAGDLEYVDKLTHALKSVKATIAMMEDEGYSGRMAYDNGSHPYRSYARRDSRGRYSGRYAREGYSRGSDMVTELRELMEDAPDDRTRAEFQRFISKIESM